MEIKILSLRPSDSNAFPDGLTPQAVKDACLVDVECMLLLEVEPCTSGMARWRFLVDEASAEQLVALRSLCVLGQEVTLALEARVWCVSTTSFPPGIDSVLFCEDLSDALSDENSALEDRFVAPADPYEFVDGRKKWAFITDEATSATLRGLGEIKVNSSCAVRFEAFDPPAMVNLECLLSPATAILSDLDVSNFLLNLNEAVLDEGIHDDWNLPDTVMPVSCNPGGNVWQFLVAADIANALVKFGTITVDSACTAMFRETAKLDKVFYRADNVQKDILLDRVLKSYQRCTNDKLDFVPGESVGKAIWCFQIKPGNRTKSFLPNFSSQSVEFCLLRAVYADGDMIDELPAPPPVPGPPPDNEETNRIARLESEHEKLVILRERYERNWVNACDPSLGFAEYSVAALAAFFRHETLRFGNPSVRLDLESSRRPISFTDKTTLALVDCSEAFSTEVAPFSRVRAMISRVRDSLREENREVIDGQVVELQDMWSEFVKELQNQQRSFVAILKSFANSPMAQSEVGAAALLYLSTTADIPDDRADPATEEWAPMFFEAWPLLRGVDGESFKDKDLRYVLLFKIYPEWNSCMDAMAASFERLRDQCVKGILNHVQVVDFDEVNRLSEKYLKSNTHPYAGQDVIALFGPTGAGKTTLVHAVHGARFETAYFGKNPHLIPRYDDSSLDERMKAFKPGYGDESETIQVSGVIVEARFTGSEDVYIIDMPGFEETRSTELGIVNAMNISRSLCACRSVRVVVVLSDKVLGDRLQVRSVQETLSNVVGILKNPMDVSEFSYVFTKMDSQANVSMTFRNSKDNVSGNLKLLYETIAEKTTPAAVIVNATSDNSGILPDVVMPQPAIYNTAEHFSHCVTDHCYLDLNSQMRLEERGIEAALKKNNRKYIAAKLEQLERLAGELPELDIIAASFESCVAKVRAEFDGACKHLKYLCEETDLDTLREGSLDTVAHKMIKVSTLSDLRWLGDGEKMLLEICRTVKRLCEVLSRRAESAGASASSYNVCKMTVWANQIQALQSALVILLPHSARLTSDETRGISVTVLCFWTPSSARSLRMAALLLNLMCDATVSADVCVRCMELTEESRLKYSEWLTDGDASCVVLDGTGKNALGRMTFEEQAEGRSEMMKFLQDAAIKADVLIRREADSASCGEDSIDGTVASALQYLARCDDLLRSLHIELDMAVNCTNEASMREEAELKKLAELSCFARHFCLTFSACFESLCDPTLISRAQSYVITRTEALIADYRAELGGIRSRQVRDTNRIRLCVASFALVHAHAKFSASVSWEMIDVQFGTLSVEHELETIKRELQTYIVETATAILSAENRIDLSEDICRQRVKYDCEMMGALSELLKTNSSNLPPTVPKLTRTRSGKTGESKHDPTEIFQQAVQYVIAIYKVIKTDLLATIQELTEAGSTIDTEALLLWSEQLSDPNAVYFHHIFHLDIVDFAQTILNRLNDKAINQVRSNSGDMLYLARAQWAGQRLCAVVIRCYNADGKAQQVRDAVTNAESIVSSFLSEFNKINVVIAHYDSLKSDALSIRKYWDEHSNETHLFDVAERNNQAFIKRCCQIVSYLPVRNEKGSTSDSFSLESEVPDQQFLMTRLDMIDEKLKAHFDGIYAGLKESYPALMSSVPIVDEFRCIDPKQFDLMVDCLFYLVHYLEFYCPRNGRDAAGDNTASGEVGPLSTAMKIRDAMINALEGLHGLIESRAKSGEVSIVELQELERMTGVLSTFTPLSEEFASLTAFIADTICDKVDEFEKSLKKNDFYRGCKIIGELRSSSKDGCEEKLELLKGRISALTEQRLRIEDGRNVWRRVSALNNAILFTHDLFDSNEVEYNEHEGLVNEVCQMMHKLEMSLDDLGSSVLDSQSCKRMYDLIQLLRVLIDSFDCPKYAVSSIVENVKVLICHYCQGPLSLEDSVDIVVLNDIQGKLLTCCKCSVQQVIQNDIEDARPRNFDAERALFCKMTQLHDQLFSNIKHLLCDIGPNFGSSGTSVVTSDNIYDDIFGDIDEGSDDRSSSGDDNVFLQRFGHMLDVFVDFDLLKSAPELWNLTETDSINFAEIFAQTSEQIKETIRKIVQDLSAIEEIYDSTASQLRIPADGGLTLMELQHRLTLFMQWIKVIPNSLRKLFLPRVVADDFVRYRNCITKAGRLSTMSRGDFSVKSLLAKQHHCNNPDVEAQLSALFDSFLRTLNGDDLVSALQSVVESGALWTAYSRHYEIPAAVSRLVGRIENLFSVGRTSILRQAGNSSPKDLQVINNNLILIREFLNSESVLKALVDDAGKGVLDRTRKTYLTALSSAFNLCCDWVESLDVCLSEMERIVQTSSEAQLSTAVPINASLIVRFNEIWDAIVQVENIIGHVHVGFFDHVPGASKIFQGKNDKLRKVFTVNDRANALNVSAKCFVDNVVMDDSNPKLNSSVRLAKTEFYTLLRFCHILLISSKISSSDGHSVNAAEMSQQFNSKMEVAIDGFFHVCEEHLRTFHGKCSSYCLYDGVAKPRSEEFTKFGEYGLQNLLVIAQIFTGDIKERAVVKARHAELIFKSEIDRMLNIVHISDAEWKNWTEERHVLKVAKALIIIKQIELSVSWTTTLSEMVGERIIDYLNLILRRDDSGQLFISKLYTNLKVLPSDAIGTKLLELDIFRHFATAHKNTQFQRVPLSKIVKEMKCDGPRGRNEDIMFLYKKYFHGASEVGTYWQIVEDCLPLNQRHKIAKIPEKVRKIVDNIALKRGDVHDLIWNLMCYCFAFWTLSPKNMEAYDRAPGDKKQNNHLAQPHPGQVIAIMRLLGLDLPEKLLAVSSERGKQRWDWLMDLFTPATPPSFTFENHLAEVKTGEGKSVVLAVAAAILALLGFNCDIVCYSEELSNRDAASFEFLFAGFHIHAYVRYVTFKGLAKLTLDSSGSVTTRLEDAILGRETSGHNSMPPKADRHSILLIDEVDVLFSTSFYGKTFDILSQLKGKEIPEIAQIFDEVYKYRNHDVEDLTSAWNEISATDVYQDLTKADGKFGEWSFLITNAVQKMLLDLSTLPHHKCHSITSEGVGYLDNDNRLVFNQRKGYHTVFELMKANESNNAVATDAMVKGMQNILVTVGALSYAEIPRQYTYILGVTGTLDCVTDEELRQYNITKKTFMRSAYPDYDDSGSDVKVGRKNVKRVPFEGKFGQDVISPSNGNSHFDNICDQIDAQSKNGLRPVLVFFKNEPALQAFYDYSRFRTAYGSNTGIMVPGCSAQDLINSVQNATVAGRITLLVSIYGRGTDFQYDDANLDLNGGIHVIITFFPNEKADQIQLQGRTARQGHPGSVSMVLDVNDFETGGIAFPQLDSLLSQRKDILGLMSLYRDVRSAAHFQVRKGLAVEKKKDHEASQSILSMLFRNNKSKLIEEMKKRNEVRQPLSGVLSRTMIMIDGTMSMVKLITHVQSKIKGILQRIQEVVKGQCGFAVQVVVYRNYNCSRPEDVLEASNWERDPLQLEQFVDCIKTDGGIGGPEAIEMAFKHAQNEISLGRCPTQIVLIGDQGPMSRREISSIRAKARGGGKSGASLWESLGGLYDVAADWEQEVDKIAESGPTFHAFYLPWYDGTYPAKEPFKMIYEKFESNCDGKYGELKVLEQDGAQRLAEYVTVKILQDLNSAMEKQGRAANYVQDYADMFQVNLDQVDGYVE